MQQTHPILFPRLLLVAVGLSLCVLGLVLYGSSQQLSPIYYALMCVVAVAVFGVDRTRLSHVQTALQAIPLPALPRAILLGYAAVVAEETLVGTLFALNEGISLSVWAERVGEFVAFNVLAFTGSIWGLAIAAWLLPGVLRLHLLIAGGWGLFAEHVPQAMLTNPIAGALIVAPNIAVYTLILAPVVLSMPERRPVRPWVLFVVPFAAWALMLAISFPAVGLLSQLRVDHPGAFPKCDYIGCN